MPGEIIEFAAGQFDFTGTLSLDGIEGITQRHIDILVRAVEPLTGVDHQFAARDRDINGNQIEFAFLVPPVRGLDNNSARGDPVVKGFQFPDLVANASLHGR